MRQDDTLYSTVECEQKAVTRWSWDENENRECLLSRFRHGDGTNHGSIYDSDDETGES